MRRGHQKQILQWMMNLHGYLSSPTAAGFAMALISMKAWNSGSRRHAPLLQPHPELPDISDCRA